MIEKRHVFRRILVPVNFTPENDRALEIAAAVAATAGASIDLLHVIETVPGIPFEELRGAYDRLEESARGRLETLATRLVAAGVEVSRHITYGQRADEIIAHAQSREVDLVVLSSHPLDPTSSSRLPGAISYKVGLVAPCAVLLAR